MNFELLHLPLPDEHPDGLPRDCRMSVELYQNARSTMGELRDIMRQLGLSWNFIRYQIDKAEHRESPLEKALRSMDPYTIGPGRSLRELPSNVW